MNKEALIREFIDEIWNRKFNDKIKTYVHEKYIIHLDAGDPWENKTLSHLEFKNRLKYSFDSFPDMHFEITSAIEETNHVAITWILTGTNSGSIQDYPPANKKIKTNGVTIYHFKDNLICGHTQIFDRKVVAEQLGYV